MIVSGEKVYLRLPNEKDIDILYIWENDPEIWEAGDNKSSLSKKEIANFIQAGQNLQENLQIRFMICHVSNDKAIGCIDLYEFDNKLHFAGVGILIYEKDDRNNGFGKEALNLLMHYSKHNLKLNHLFCRVLEKNVVSQNLFTSLGFTIQSKEFNTEENAQQITMRRQFI